MVAPANNLPNPESAAAKVSNLRARLFTGMALGAAILAALFLLPATPWNMLVLLFIAAGAWEWAGILKLAGAGRYAYAVLTPAASLALDMLPAVPVALVVALFWLLLAPLWLQRAWPLSANGGGLLLGGLIGWLILAPTGHAAMHLHAYSRELLLACLLLTVIADSAAYFSGRRFGRRKLAPRISPGKTWEGVLGATLAVALFALVWPLLRLDCDPTCLLRWQVVAFLLLVASVLGDLFESHAKRQAGLKDSGDWLPGHGGVLDRIDSLTAVLPAAVLFWMWLK